MKTCVHREGRIFLLRCHREIAGQLSLCNLCGKPGECEFVRIVANRRTERGQKDAIAQRDIVDPDLASKRRDIAHGRGKLDAIEQCDISFFAI